MGGYGEGAAAIFAAGAVEGVQMLGIVAQASGGQCVDLRLAVAVVGALRSG